MNPQAPHNKMLEYAMRETQNAVRVMFRTRSTSHVFNWGTGPDGVKYVMVLQVVPESVLPEGVYEPSTPTQEEKELTDESLKSSN